MSESSSKSKQSWPQAEVTHPAEVSEAVAFHLFETGAGGVVQEPLPRNDGWITSRAGYEPQLDSESLRRDLERRMETVSNAFGLNRALEIRWDFVESGDWAEKWKEGLHPIEIGERLVIKPTWCDYPPQSGRIIISLDPGMAFGTGLHATTRMCLVVLEKMLRRAPDAFPKILDIGTGSGILAMAAAVLSKGYVAAVDIDPEAVDVAADNLKLNHLSQRVHLAVGGPEILKSRFDLILANLTANPLRAMALTMKRLIKPGGAAVLSGLLRHQADEVLGAYQDRGFSLDRRLDDEEWSALVLSGPAEDSDAP